MPISRYNRAFGGKSGAAGKAKRAMLEQYGPEKGERVFYATVNSRTPGIRRSTRGSKSFSTAEIKRGYRCL